MGNEIRIEIRAINGNWTSHVGTITLRPHDRDNPDNGKVNLRYRFQSGCGVCSSGTTYHGIDLDEQDRAVLTALRFVIEEIEERGYADGEVWEEEF